MDADSLLDRLNRIVALQCGQTTDVIFGTRLNLKPCLHFVQVADLIFDFEADIGT